MYTATDKEVNKGKVSDRYYSIHLPDMSVKGSLKNSYPSDFQARRNRKALKSIVKKLEQ